MHVCFLWKPIAFARITGDARADDVLPCRRPSPITRHHVIEIQFAALKNLAAILAGVLVALENIVARELHFLFRETIEKE